MDTIPQACDSWAATKGAYRFIENDRVSAEALRQAVSEATARQCAPHQVVVAVQDTTALSFPTARNTTGLGPVTNVDVPGMFVHSVLALREDGVPIGLLGQQTWCRDPQKPGTRKKRKKRPIEGKESRKWIEGIDAARKVLGDHLPQDQRPRLIHVFDREGDIHEVFEAVLATNDGAVIRCAQNRCVRDDGTETEGAHERVRRAPVLARQTIDVPRKRGQRARTASVDVRACKVTLIPRSPHHRARAALTLTLVEVWEPRPPQGIKALHWLLWTTEAVTMIDQALYVIGIYKKRWKIEEVHLVLKSGCRIEDVRFETAQRIEKAVALYAPIAVRIVQLRDLSRLEADAPCTQVLRDDEWRTLWTYIHKTPPRPQQPPPSLRQATLWIGRLGGHLGRKSDGMPGVRTLWRGWRDLEMLTEITQIYASLRS